MLITPSFLRRGSGAMFAPLPVLKWPDLAFASFEDFFARSVV